jgi:hypothetical protein
VMLLNPDKSEVLLFARRPNDAKFASRSGINVAASPIAYCVQRKSLGITLDQKLTFDQQSARQQHRQSSNFNIRVLRHIRPMFDRTVANTVACSIVSTRLDWTRLDYSNSLLYGTSAKNIQKLQRVENALARVVSGTRKFDHFKTVLRELHWLPVAQRVQYEVALITHKVLYTRQPHYLKRLITDYKPTRQLRSENGLKPSGLTSTAGLQTFTRTLEAVWNKLPEDIRISANLQSFKSKLKTFLFAAVDWI